MVKRSHHRSAVRNVLAGTIGTLGALAVSTQVASANHVIVKAGDTVWNIAQQHQTSVAALENANANAIKKVSDSVDLIYAGQQLTLPGEDTTTMQVDQNGRYTVKPGDTLSKIAQHFHVSVTTLMAWNGLTSDQLYIGQQLFVNGQAVTTTTTAPVANQAVVTSAAPVASVAPAASQEAAPVETSTSTPVQSASADQQQVVSATASVANVTSAEATSTATSATATSTAVTSTADQTATNTTTVASSDPASVATATNTAATSTADSTTDVTSTTSTNTSSATTTVASASATDRMALAAATNSSASAAPVATSQTSAVATGAVSAAPVSTATSVATASSAPVSTNASVTTTATSASATPQPAASQAPVSAVQSATSQAPVSAVQSATPQSASQAPAQTSQAATPVSAQPQSNGSQNLNSGSVVSLAVKIANSNSVPYVWGGSSLNGMDCSGLVDYVYAHAEGKQLPHNTVALESCVNQHAVSQAQAGDILFWGQHGSTYHCAIYTGNNQFVAAAKPGTNVASYTISPYFEPSFAGTVK